MAIRMVVRPRHLCTRKHITTQSYIDIQLYPGPVGIVYIPIEHNNI